MLITENWMSQFQSVFKRKKRDILFGKLFLYVFFCDSYLWPLQGGKKEKYYFSSMYLLSFNLSYKFGCWLVCMMPVDDPICSFAINTFFLKSWLTFCWSIPTQYFSLVLIQNTLRNMGFLQKSQCMILCLI